MELNIFFDNYLIIFNNDNNFVVNEELLDTIQRNKFVIVDPANIKNLEGIYNKNATGAGFASGAIYKLYDIDIKVDYDYIAFDNYRKSPTNYKIKKYEAIGLHHRNKGWVIHVVAPNKKEKYEENMLLTYSSIFRVFCGIRNSDPSVKLRLSLAGLGSYYPFNKSGNINYLYNILCKIFYDTHSNSVKMVKCLKASIIYFALGKELNKVEHLEC